MFIDASLAQLFRALPCQGRGRELESLSSHHMNLWVDRRGVYFLLRINLMIKSFSVPKPTPTSSGGGLSSYCIILNDICQEENINLTWLSNNWLALLERNGQQRFIMGYKFDLNSAIAAGIADDKFATFDVLSNAKIPVVRHALLYEPGNNDVCARGKNSLGYVQDFFIKHHEHIVIKPNNGTRGMNVHEISQTADIEPALREVFHQSYSASMCPFYQIKREYRLIMLDGEEKISYYKERCNDWRFNLGHGAIAYEITNEALHQKLLKIAQGAVRAIGLRFCSVDIIETTNHELLVLEVNSGVMTRKFLSQYPERHPDVYKMYHEAVKKMFAESPDSMLK